MALWAGVREISALQGSFFRPLLGQGLSSGQRLLLGKLARCQSCCFLGLTPRRFARSFFGQALRMHACGFYCLSLGELPCCFLG